jgi:molybdenum-dependent DNA-binding transcriptional regulator ModE
MLCITFSNYNHFICAWQPFFAPKTEKRQDLFPFLTLWRIIGKNGRRLAMSASKYQVLLRVVELGSVTRAAEELGYTQSGVSHIISGLENELQLVLLHRSRTGVTLTDAGKRLLPQHRRIRPFLRT